jgi:hypothetical protein
LTCALQRDVVFIAAVVMVVVVVVVVAVVVEGESACEWVSASASLVATSREYICRDATKTN